MAARSAYSHPRPRARGRWLALVAAMVFAIVIVGGITRLTESGLSITTWQPLTGIVPPLTHAAWVAEFDNYKRIPQYELYNHGMTLGGFRHIFFWEYLHRLLARTIGTVLAMVAVLVIGRQVAAIDSVLVGGIALRWGDWAILALLPIAFALLATLAARVAVLRTLRTVL